MITALRLVAVLAATLVVASGRPARAGDAVVDRFPDIAPAYAVVIDGRLTWGGHLDTPRLPASLAKLPTALTLLNGSWKDDEVVTVSARAAGVEGSRVGLRAGEQLRAGDLLTAMLVRSANDACLALVEHAAGDLAAFLPRLEARARELGLTASRFRHPCGLDADGSRTTARDLTRVAEAALAEPRITLRSGAVEGRIRTLAGRELRFHNSNALVGRDPAVIGLKSGYTQHAGRCLVAVAERGGHRVVLVMLGAEERWWAASNLIAVALAQAGAPP